MTSRTTVAFLVLVLGGASIWWIQSVRTREVSVPDALVFARHAPILGIAGTDPAALATNVGDLERAVEELAAAQSSEAEAEMVRALYPTRFLAALAELEAHRHAFLRSESRTDAESYHAHITIALDAYEADAARFADALALALPERPARFPTFGGTITTERMRTAAIELPQAAMRMRAEHEHRMRCLTGRSYLCGAVPKLSLPPLAPESSPLLPTQIRDVLALRAEARGAEPPEETLVTLESACTAETEKPHYLTVHSTTNEFSIFFVNDLFFAPTAGFDGPTVRHLSQIGIDYVFLNPLNYYTCPSILHDSGRARALMEVRSFAQQHPALAPHERDAVLRDALTEAAVHTYLTAALASRGSEDVSGQVEELALMYSARTAGLEFVVEDITNITLNDLRLQKSGVPFDLSASKLFLSHSAFPSLFLVHASADATNVFEPHFHRDASEFWQYAIPYSSLRNNVPHEELVANFHAFMAFEDKL